MSVADRRPGGRSHLRPLALLGGLFLLALPHPARAIQQCTMNFLGNRYDVYQVPRASGFTPNLNSINNVVIYHTGTGDIPSASGTGDVAGVAVAYGPEGGLSLIQNAGSQTGVLSEARDINHNDLILGWRQAPGGQRRAFTFSNRGPGYKFLDELYPSVAAVGNELDGDTARGTRGWALNDAGQMVLSDSNNSEGHAYLLQADGSLDHIPASALECVEFGSGMINSAGQLTPPGVDAGDYCSILNIALNDDGTVVGVERLGTDGPTFAIRDGIRLTGGEGARPTSVNKDGWVGGYPGLLWNPAGQKFDIGAAIGAQCDPSKFSYSVLSPGNVLSENVFVNDELWFATEDLFLRPAVPDVIYGTSGTGFEFFNDGTPNGTGVGVAVGNHFTVTATLQNLGRNAFHNIVLESTQDASLFRRISGPTPPLPSSLEPGATFQTTYEFEATGPGVLTSVTSLRGTDPSGVPFDFSEEIPIRRIIFVGKGGLNATIKATPGKVAIGDTFTATLKARNTSNKPLHDVHPAGPLLFTGDGTATIQSGPTPLQAATLAAGASQDFVYQLQAAASGNLSLQGSVTGKTETDQTVTSVAQCSVGDEEATLADARSIEEPAVCSVDMGAAVEIKPCTVNVEVSHDSLRFVRLAGDADPPANTGYKPGAT